MENERISIINQINLLKRTSELLHFQEEKRKLKGEIFNVFSILKIDSHENKTHSAFLGELLSPKGTHQMGTTFLDLFLKELGVNQEKLDASTANTKLEHHIGKKDLELNVGGRIDIYISDKDERSLSIENKIYAGDQEKQIERYCKHNIGLNQVYYLTLFGHSPSKASRGEKKEGVDFYTLSYRDHIIPWLESCIKEAYEYPVLRETIKQYQILIKKLTNTMDRSEADKLYEAMLDNITEAEFIAGNLEKMKINFANKIRDAVFNKLNELFSEKYKITKGSPVKEKYSQIWIEPKNALGGALCFGLESFGVVGRKEKPYFIGIFNSNKNSKNNIEEFEDFDIHNDYWMDIMEIEPFDDYPVNNRSPKTLKKYHRDNEFKEDFVAHIVNKVQGYIEKHTPKIESFVGKKF